MNVKELIEKYETLYNDIDNELFELKETLKHTTNKNYYELLQLEKSNLLKIQKTYLIILCEYEKYENDNPYEYRELLRKGNYHLIIDSKRMYMINSIVPYKTNFEIRHIIKKYGFTENQIKRIN